MSMEVDNADRKQLVVQNAALVLFMHYSRVMPLVNGDRYYASTAVFLSEVVKLSFFLSMALYEIATNPQTPDTSTVSELSNALSKAVFTGDSWKLAIPAMLFTLQNSLQYVAASNLDAATFSVTYQLKIVSTAIFGTFFLGRILSLRRWMSLALMAFGVAIVQMSCVSREGRVLSIKDLRDGVSFHAPRSIWDMEAEGNEAAGRLNKRSATYEGIDEDFAAAHPKMNGSVGLAAAVLACALSGLACVYFERILKAKDSSKASVWVRNVQLSFYSIWPALFLGVLFMDGEHIAKTGFFTGYNWVVWVVILLQAAGAVLVAMALTYADSMAKSLSTSFAAVITFLASALFLEFQTTSLVSTCRPCLSSIANSHLVPTWHTGHHSCRLHLRFIAGGQKVATSTHQCQPVREEWRRRARILRSGSSCNCGQVANSRSLERGFVDQPAWHTRERKATPAN